MGKRAGSHVMLSPLKLLIGAHADQIVMADIFIFKPVSAAEVLSPHVSLSSHHEMHLIRCITICCKQDSDLLFSGRGSPFLQSMASVSDRAKAVQQCCSSMADSMTGSPVGSHQLI